MLSALKELETEQISSHPFSRCLCHTRATRTSRMHTMCPDLFETRCKEREFRPCFSGKVFRPRTAQSKKASDMLGGV